MHALSPLKSLLCATLLSALAHGAMAAQPALQDALFNQNTTFDPDKHPGKALYQLHCASCHEGAMPKAPHREFLETMPPQAIITALTTGIMAQEAAALDSTQKQQVAEYLARTDLTSYKPQPGATACTGDALDFDLNRPPANVGWGYDPRRFVPDTVAGLTADDVPNLKLKWAFAFPAALRARSQPVVAMGAVFVGSQDGTVYAFDLHTGCARWTSNVGAEVRTAIVVESWPEGTIPERSPRLYFGDLLGRAYALDALTGEVLWRTRVDDHPTATITGTPLLRDGTLYVPVSSLEVTTAATPSYPCCTFRGSMLALDAASGKIKWRHYSVDQPATEQGKTSQGTAIMGPSGGGVWTSPTMDAQRGLIYHGSGQNYSPPADGNSDAIFAVDAKTGKRVWHQQMTANDIWTPACIVNSANCVHEKGLDHDIAASILLINLDKGKQILVAGQKSGMVYGLDPDNKGELLWKQAIGRGSVMGGVHFGMASEGTRIYVPVVDTPMQADGSMAPDYAAAGIHAIDAATGEILWQALKGKASCDDAGCHPGVSAALTAIPGVVFAGHLDGIFRAYDGATGKVLWESDTTVPAPAVNGVNAVGGSMSGPGAAIADGHVIVNSGYSYAMFKPGNALLVYSVDGK